MLEAERLAAGNDWRGGVNRFRALLDQWKALPRLDRATDDELWHRFSSARTTYTRRRKAQFARENEAREAARVIKEQLVVEAEALADSTDWGPTTGAYRDLMTRWKAAGPAPRGVDEALWKRFRAAQDTFFARQAGDAQPAGQRVPGQRRGQGGAAGRGGGRCCRCATRTRPRPRSATSCALGRDRQGAAGLDPDAGRPAPGGGDRHQAEAENDRWRRTNPETRARAEDTAAKLEAQIAALEERAAKAEARGDTRAAREAAESAATYREWLDPGSAGGERLPRLRTVTGHPCGSPLVLGRPVPSPGAKSETSSS